MKLVHLVHGLNTGGAETLIKNYALYFDKNRINVVVLCLKHEEESPYEKILTNNGVRIICAEDYLLFKDDKNIFLKCLNRVNYYFVVRRILRNESPDVLHLHLLSNRYAKFAKLPKDTKLFYTIHSDPMALWFENKKTLKEYRATKWLIKFYGMKIIVLHEEMRKKVRELFCVSDVILLNNGVDADSIKKAGNAKLTRKELGIPIDSFVLGHIGRFSRVKNQDFLIDVFIDIQNKKKNAFLLLIGDGSDKKMITEELDANGMSGKYLILSNRSDIPDLLNAMDVFVFPSLYEGLPLSLIEAQIARKPCFVSDTINEYVDISNLITRLSLKQSAEEWAEAIVNYKKPKKIIVNDDDWDIKKVTKQLEQIYLDALAEQENGKK